VSVAALHHESGGPREGRALVLGSSLGTSIAMWDPLIGELSRAHDVIRFDHRGHGASPLPSGPSEIADLGGDVLALLDRLGLERVDYAGVSLGGMVGMWLAAHAPERIASLVVICSSALLGPPEMWASRAGAVRDAGSVDAVADAVIERWFSPSYAAAHPDVLAWMRRMLHDCPPEGYASLCEAIGGMDLRGALASIVAPTLVIAAAQDPATPPAHGEAIAASVAGARLIVLGRGAHMAAIEHPGEVAAMIVSHVEART